MTPARDPPSQPHDIPAQNLDDLNARGRALGSFVPGGQRAVFGEGPLNAPLLLVGEQPGDKEDEAGRPFVGPAGHLLDRALARAGIAREAVYLTNVVKHFKYIHIGKRRIHQRPTVGEVRHYRWWLEQEIALVAPRLVVAMGATAVSALTAKAQPISRIRGPAKLGGWPGYVTVHPAAILRVPADDREASYAAFVRDLTAARRLSEAP